ncbi:DUF5011 domain-containing protein [Bacteroidales bacterium OttesenSCG-928-I21]|nr:DUF5011 domain-containing protein [Bacteroidales bacterium OttesenSCG-928-I21]
MDKRKSFILVIAILVGIIFTGCLGKDTTKPNIQLYGMNKTPIFPAPEGKYDTVVLLQTKYTDPDPAVWVDDNKSLSENITVTSDIEDILNVKKNNWYIVQTGDYTITYTARDEEGNSNQVARKMRAANVAEAFSPANEKATTYKLLQRISNIYPNSPSYNMNITVNSKTAGVIRLPKVYQHDEVQNGSTTTVSYSLNAHLYSENLSQQVSEKYGYLGQKDNPEKPFFEVYNNGRFVRNLTLKEAVDSIVSETSPIRITELKIEDQIVYTDPNNDTKYVRIRKRSDNTKSTVEYLGNSPYKITLAYELVDTRSGQTNIDYVIEKYEKIYLEE